jgi:glycosyltransferase involved in cell wall biosynthesis
MRAADAIAGSNRPLVTVIVPTRSRPVLLQRAVSSVMDQDYPGSIECIVVFDQSPPVKPSVGFAEGRELRVLYNHREPGLAGARNTGVLAAKGDFVAFCDDDDEWMSNKLRLQIDFLEKHERALATCGIYVRYGRRTIIRLPPVRITFRDILRSRFMEVNPCTILIRRSTFLKDVGLVDEAIPGGIAEDYEWLLRAARILEIVAIRAPLVRINWHEASWYSGHWRTLIAALTYVLKTHPELRGEPIGLARIYGQIAFAHAALREDEEALRYVFRSLSLNWKEPRAYLALLVRSHLVSSRTVLRLLHSLGRGV